MGLLDDLKRQADMVRTHDSLQRSNLQENTRVVDEAMHRTFLYLLELFKQLEVLKPANPTVYDIVGVGELKDLKYVSGFVDPRKRKFADRDVYDYMEFYVKWAAPDSMVVSATCRTPSRRCATCCGTRTSSSPRSRPRPSSARSASAIHHPGRAHRELHPQGRHRGAAAAVLRQERAAPGRPTTSWCRPTSSPKRCSRSSPRC